MSEHHSFSVGGMTCTGCEDRITDALDPLAGPESARADHETGTVTVAVDPGRVTDTQVIGIIEDLGYRVERK
ncbi:MAG: heavy-metal-associated domain-containing protein [Acidimicrobiia bacterium]